jgi:hypothetical protein
MPPLSRGQKIFLRISGIIAMALFLLPTFYVVKYFSVDRSRELHIADHSQDLEDILWYPNAEVAANPDYIPALASIAAAHDPTRVRCKAITLLTRQLLQPAVSFRRPVECLQAKSTLAGIAANDSDVAVRAAAQDSVGKIAQGGVVVRR